MHALSRWAHFDCLDVDPEVDDLNDVLCPGCDKVTNDEAAQKEYVETLKGMAALETDATNKRIQVAQAATNKLRELKGWDVPTTPLPVILWFGPVLRQLSRSHIPMSSS